MSVFLKALPVALVALLIGCATIMRGTSQSIAVNSNPSGAKVIVMGMEKGTTPAVVKVSRKETNLIIRLQKDGYEPVEVALTRSVSGGWVIGDILFSNLLGLVVDFVAGGVYNINPDVINADLKAIHGMNMDPSYPRAFFEIQIVETD